MPKKTTNFRPHSQICGTCGNGTLQLQRKEPCAHRCCKRLTPDDRGNCNGHRKTVSQQQDS